MSPEGFIVAHIPTREQCDCQITLGTDSYTKAAVFMQALGLQATWD